ncbi:MAG: YbhB/YbcL family Raf kinase inhibitor-like protein [Syntrophaceae bacterium]|nr:YbhB/YbcL family Raf kinase inhibitor-like protein [Syntrophaceae bacterium]
MKSSRVNFTVLSVFICLSLLFLTCFNSSAKDLELKSPAFVSGSMIPSLYTCEGKNISPPLSWTGVPPGTKSFVLICDDPDVPFITWVHWVYYNIPASVKSLPEALPKTEKPAQGGIHGKNSFSDFGYGGPCPLWGTHRYFFKLYALDTMLNLPSGAKKKDVLKAMDKHVLAKAELMGKFKKK